MPRSSFAKINEGHDVGSDVVHDTDDKASLTNGSILEIKDHGGGGSGSGGGLDKSAAHAFEPLITSDQVSGRWTTHYFGERHDSPIPDIVKELAEVEDDLKDRPELLKFMLETTALVRGIQGKSRDFADTPEEGDARAELLRNFAKFDAYINGLASGVDLPHREDLPEEYQKVLALIEKETGQQAIRPVAGTAAFFKNYISHIAEHVREKPASATAALAVSLGVVWLANHKMGNAVTNYIDPTSTQINNFGAGEFGQIFEFDPTMPVAEFERTCHSHVEAMFGKTVADIAAPIMPQHCDKFKTLAEDAQGNVAAGYDLVNARIEGLIKMPVSDLVGKLIDNEAFMRGFETGARNTADFIYKFNTVENITLHYIIGQLAFDQGRKLGRLTSDEAREGWQKISNFTYRTAVNAPMAYAAGLSLAAQSYLENGMNPEMVWMGAGGALAGQLGHKAFTRFFNGKSRAEAMMEESRARMEAFKYAGSSVQGDKPTLLVDKKKKHGAKVAFGALGGVGTYGVLVSECPEVAGMIAGSAAVGGSFLAYNVPEDAALHVIFGIVGGAAGYGYGMVERRGGGILKRAMPWRKNADPDVEQAPAAKLATSPAVEPEQENGPSNP